MNEEICAREGIVDTPETRAEYSVGSKDSGNSDESSIGLRAVTYEQVGRCALQYRQCYAIMRHLWDRAGNRPYNHPS